MAPNQQRETSSEDTRQPAGLVWYHDLRWSLAKLEAREEGAAGHFESIEATLKLSDGRQSTVQFKTPEQLGKLIGSLERAI